MSSFFCERTAEYTVVPHLTDHLRLTFRIVVPIFFWATREGSKESLARHEPSHVRILAVFARRPKTCERPNLLKGKLNAELFRFARVAYRLGVFSVAAIPIARSVFELGPGAPVLYLSLSSSDDHDVEFLVDRSPLTILQRNADMSDVTTLSLSDISEAVEHRTRPLAWSDAVRVMSNLRRELVKNGSRWMPFSSGYKPVYFVLLEKST